MSNSIWEATGLTMRFRQPKWIGSLVIPGYDNVAPRVTDYGHKIVTNGGFWDAGLSMPISFDESEDWAVDGLGRHFECYNPPLERIFSGFVNKITISLGGFAVVIGPMLEITNRAKQDYKTITYNTNPPVRGRSTTTAWNSDTDSIARYGQLETILTGGEMAATEATQLRDTFLEENKDPQTSHTISSDGQESTMSLEIVGYVQLMERAYPDTSAGGYGTTDLSTKAASVIEAHPTAGIFSSDVADITANTTQVAQAETSKKTALKVLKKLAAYGTADNARQTFGVYANEIFKLEVLPSTPAYRFNIRSGSRWLYDYNIPENRIDPWNILPGRIVFIADWLTGKQAPQDTQIFRSEARLRKDPRYMVIEAVEYTAPFSFTITGQKKGRPGEAINATGLGGTS